MEKTALNSTSLDRARGPEEDYVRGSVNNLPFMPGGMQSRLGMRTQRGLPAQEADEGTLQGLLASKSLVEIDPEVVEEMQIERENMQEENARHKLKFNEIFSNRYFDFSASESEEDSELEESFDEEEDEEGELEEETEEKDSQVVQDIEDIQKPKSKANRKKWGIMEPIRKPEEINELYAKAVPNPAIEYPFELDAFQKQAIMHIERNENVLVSAHTSSGKTVVAEYAIAKSCRNLTKTIYTSPIKTLSNQKYREFKRSFDDVGIITGDVSLNPEASCLILTTEILRSMLYKGADLIRDVEWVIFDEVHYINDVDRGVVWEEVIIMLPAHINIIMLSATVPNTLEFASWVGRTKQKEIYVVRTAKRPVPLQHYLWTNNKMFLVVNSQGKFIREGFKNARFAGLSEKDKQKQTQSGKQVSRNPFAQKRVSQKNQWMSLINYLKKKELLPVAVFSLSKRKCESSVAGLSSLDLSTASEKSEIHIMIESALKRLQPCDQELPQILRVSEMLKRGLGLHHSGLLPLVKELVEMIYSRGLVRVLFATETFAMGVNMPTRTVVFNGLRKFDGRAHRSLLPGEYTQMAGRAGRRGLDTFGMVVINCVNDELPDENEVHRMVLGKPTKLSSQFRLNYNMMVNLLRVEDFGVEDVIKRSFNEFHAQSQVPAQKIVLDKEQKLLAKMKDSNIIECVYDDPELISNYYNIQKEITDLNSFLMETVLRSGYRSKFFSPGRVFSVSKFGMFERPAVLLDTFKDHAETFIAFILPPQDWDCSDKRFVKAVTAEPFEDWVHSQYWITLVKPSNIVYLMDAHLKVTPSNILLDRRQDDILQLRDSLMDLEQNGQVSILDPVHDMGISSLDFHEAYQRMLSLNDDLVSSPCHSCPKLTGHYNLAQDLAMIEQRIELLQESISDDNIEMLFEFKRRLAVLQQLQYIDENHTVLLKGRVACEINTCECVLVTEIIYENILMSLSIEETVALLSCFIFQQKTDEVPKLTENLEEAKDKVLEIARVLGHVQVQNGVNTTVDDYIAENINIGLMEVVYEWTKGTPFGKICELTTIEEGVIVRCITRLDETCRDVRNAARVMGDAEMYQKMEKASEAIKRDIVFAASLYVQ